MNFRIALIAIFATVSAGVAGAQPDKQEQRPKAPPAAAKAPLVLASAADVRQPSTAAGDRPVESFRRPAPRVTTCRCGDPQPAEAQPDQ